MLVTVDFEWVPSWKGRRWELRMKAGGLWVTVGRVVRFFDGQIEAHVYVPLYRPIVGPFESFLEAAMKLKKAAAGVKRRRQRR